MTEAESGVEASQGEKVLGRVLHRCLGRRLAGSHAVDAEARFLQAEVWGFKQGDRWRELKFTGSLTVLVFLSNLPTDMLPWFRVGKMVSSEAASFFMEASIFNSSVEAADWLVHFGWDGWSAT
ncbi:hypothetical protein OPV22_004685 [Ensete ventricosum]|uniref:Uncharacterized protein n=1 Tax=Ensete ventricosum TaxID=4639 RepID=A0AAV8RJC6_ENSVE|nr:hypothetical protein OPV22_004685 [Ensete ventricosum]